jgi:hypothetical protein
MWAVKILSFDEQVVIDSVGGLLIYPDGLARGKGRLEIDTGQYDQSGAAFIPSACAGLYRRAMLEEVGLFDEDFFVLRHGPGLRARLAVEYRGVPGAWYTITIRGPGAGTPLQGVPLRNRIWVALLTFLEVPAPPPFTPGGGM